MEELCEWCSSPNITSRKESVYWELPDGTRAIQITETPAVFCGDCQVVYQTEETIKEIEDQLFLVNRNLIGQTIAYDQLMGLPRLLKRNYFDFKD